MPSKSSFSIGKSFLATCFMLVTCSTYSLTLKMEATYSSETSVDFQRITQRYIPEDRTMQGVLNWPLISIYCQGRQYVYVTTFLHALQTPFFNYYYWWGGTKSLVLRPLLGYCTSPTW
jgi:hypothetical protein